MSALAVVLAAVTTVDALAGTFTFNPTFETERQSVWGTGTAAVSINKTGEFLGARWGQPDQGGPVAGQVSFGNYTDGNGFRLVGETSGRIGMEYGLKIDSGSIDASLPYTVSITTPRANTLTQGAYFTIDTAATFNAQDATFVTRSPTFQMYSDFIFEVDARMHGQASVDLFFFDKQVTFDKKILDVDVREELIAINRDNDGEIRVLPLLFSAQSTASEAYDNAEAAKELKQEVSQATGRREKVKIGLKKLGASFSLESPLEASIRLPYIEMDGSQVEIVGNKLRQSDKDGFADFSFDLDRIAGIMVPQIPPMTVNAELDFVVGALETSVTLIDVDFNPTLNLTQQATVEAQKVLIDFNMGQSRDYRVLDANGNFVRVGNGQIATIDAGQKLEVIYDGTDMSFAPTYRVDAELQSEFGLSISSQLAFRALMASLEAKLFGVELGGFEIGPAFETSIDFPDVSLGNLFDSTFDLTGFNSVSAPTLFISDKPAVFIGTSGGQWSADANWIVGGTNTAPDLGRGAQIPASTIVNVSGTGNESFHLDIGLNSHVNIGAGAVLSVGGNIYNGGTLNVGVGGTLNLEEDPTEPLGHVVVGGSVNLNGATLIVKNDVFTPAVAGEVAFIDTAINMENSSLMLQGGRGRMFLSGTDINVTNAANNPANLSVIGNTDGAYGFDIVKDGASPTAVNLTNGANLRVEFGSMTTVFPGVFDPSPAELVAGGAPIIGQMLRFNVGNGSTLSLKGSNLPSNFSGLLTPGTIEDAHFVTTGTGVVKNVGALTLSASIFDGNFVADAADNPAGVSTTFRGLGSMTGEVTPVVNNGTMTFIARAGQNNTIYTNGGAIAGAGEMQLIGYGNNPVTLRASGTPVFLNAEGHTIRIDNAVIGSSGRPDFDFFNRGTILVDKNFGSNTGYAYIQNGNDGVNGDFINESTGLVRAQNGAHLEFKTSTYMANKGRVEVGDQSKATVSVHLDNMWSNTPATGFTTIFMDQGSWKTEYSGQLEIGGLGVSSVATILSSKTDFEIAANFAAPSTAGIYIVRSTGAKTRLDQFATFRNESIGQFGLSLNSTIDFPDFENYGILDLSNSTIRGVQNFQGGLVFGSGEVQLQQTSPGVATNSGIITAVRSENNGQLTVSAPAGVTTIVNSGTMGAMGADLVFPNGVIVSSSGGTLTGGMWVVEGGTTDYTNTARVLVPLASSNLTGLSNTKITLKGSGASFDSFYNNANFRSMAQTLTSINSGAIVTLDANTQNFTNRITVNTGGQLILNNGAHAGGAGFDVYGLIAGNGHVDAPIKTFGGTVEAEKGLLTFNADIDNTAVVGGFAGTILANDPGAVLNPKGVSINGGRLIVNSIGAALYGSGAMSPSTFENKGIVAADTQTLTFTGSGSFTNTGEMTTRERGILQFSSMTLNNTGGLVSAVDTNGLDLQTDGGGIGGTVRLRGATISGGTVAISGYTTYAGGATDPVAGINAKLDGYGSLSNVTLRTSNAQVTVDPTLVTGGSNLNITPASGVQAILYNSTITTRNGGNLSLNDGSFSGIGSTFTAENNSFINLSGARLEDTKLATAGSGQVRVVLGNASTLAAVKNTGRVSILTGATLNLADTIDNRGGTIDNRGTLSLSDADLVGGSVINNFASTVAIPGRAQILGANFINAGTVRVDAPGNLTINQSSDGTTSASSFSNIGTMDVYGTLNVINSSFSTTGTFTVQSGGSLVATSLSQNGGTVRVNGAAEVANYWLNAGTLYGAGRITGNLRNVGGVIAPGNSPGTLNIDGDLELFDDSELVMQVEFLDTYDRIVSGGDMTLTGRVILDFSDVLPEALGAFLDRQVEFDLFDQGPGKTIVNQGLYFVAQGQGIEVSNISFEDATGSVSVFVSQVPEPGVLVMAPLAGWAMSRRRRRVA